MANFMRVANDDSPRLQQTFSSADLLKVSEFLLKFLHINNLIVEITLSGRLGSGLRAKGGHSVLWMVVWPMLALPGVAPVGIRVGSYAVRPGLTGVRRAGRGIFKIEVAIIDDLYDRPRFPSTTSIPSMIWPNFETPRGLSPKPPAASA